MKAKFRGYVYMMVSSDKYEFPLAIADTVQELSRIIGVNSTSITTSIIRSERGLFKSHYKRVYIGDDEEQREEI